MSKKLQTPIGLKRGRRGLAWIQINIVKIKDGKYRWGCLYEEEVCAQGTEKTREQAKQVAVQWRKANYGQ